MTKHPFRVAVESGAKHEDLVKLFSPQAEILAPMLMKPVIGAPQVLNVILHAARIAGPISYLYEVADARQTFLIWQGHVGGYTLQACTILVDGDDGLIRQVRVLMRPWPVTKLFRDAMYKELADVIPQDYWELGPKPVSAGSRRLTPIALKPIAWADDLILHSPMLAKPVNGKREVAEAVRIAHEIQSASSYTSIIATQDLVIELFDYDADGYPMEGLWIQKLDDRGEIDDITVMFRPWPAITVLPNRAKELAEQIGVLGPEYWNLE